MLFGMTLIAQNKISSINNYEKIEKDSVFYFQLYSIKETQFNDLFDNIILKNIKCLKKHKWECVGNNYFFTLIFFKTESGDLGIELAAISNTSVIKTNLLAYLWHPEYEVYSGIINYKNYKFLISNPNKISTDMYLSKMNGLEGIRIIYPDCVHYEKDGTVSSHKIKHSYIFKNNTFKQIKETRPQ